MFPYATTTDDWEDWQLDYRLGLVLILPPPEISCLIDPLRAHYDPKAHRICPTHISISDPLQLELTPVLDAEISAILAGIQPFRLHFDKPAASDLHPGVAYPIRPQEPIDDLKGKLHQADIFAGKIYRRRSIPAHMTIAEFVTIQESWRILAEIEDRAPSGSFLCDQLALIIPDRDFQFKQVKSYFLGE